MSLPSGTYWPAEYLVYDAGNEPGHFRVYGLPLDDPDTIAANDTKWSELKTAMDALQLGAPARASYLGEQIVAWTQPTNGAAREIKLLVQYQDNTTGQKLTCTVPTLDPTIPVYVLNTNAKDVVRVDTPAAITTFITKFQAFVVNPVTGNPVTVIGLKVVGRNI